MARAVVGGLITSTLLTLIVVPGRLHDPRRHRGVAVPARKRRRGGRRGSGGAGRVARLRAAGARGRAAVAASRRPPTCGRRPRRRRWRAGRSRPRGRRRPAAGEGADARAGAGDRGGAEPRRPEGHRVQELGPGQVRRGARRGAAAGDASAAASRGPSTTRQSKLFRGLRLSAADRAARRRHADIGEIFGGPPGRLASGSSASTQVLFTWGQVGAAIRAAKLGFEYSDQQLRRFRQAVVRDVTAAVLQRARRARARADRRGGPRAEERHLDETTKRQQAGTATDYDVLAAQVARRERASPRSSGRRTGAAGARAAAVPAGRAAARSTSTARSGATAEPAPTYDELLARGARQPAGARRDRHAAGIYGELVTIAEGRQQAARRLLGGLGQAQPRARRRCRRTAPTGTPASFATVPLFDGWRTKGQVAQARSDLASIEHRRAEAARRRSRWRCAPRSTRCSEAAEILGALDGHRRAGRAAAVPRREGLRARREDAPRGAGRRAEPAPGARQPGRRAARLPGRARQPRLGDGHARRRACRRRRSRRPAAWRRVPQPCGLRSPAGRRQRAGTPAQSAAAPALDPAGAADVQWAGHLNDCSTVHNRGRRTRQRPGGRAPVPAAARLPRSPDVRLAG